MIAAGGALAPDARLAFKAGWEAQCASLGLQVAGLWATSPNIGSIKASQGWKLHLSATATQAVRMLQSALPVVQRYGQPFKVIARYDDIARLNSGVHFGYSQIGKLVTVYLVDETCARALARELADALKDVRGPAVPSDVRFVPDAPVYYRFGAFDGLHQVQRNGMSLPALLRPDGRRIVDDRRRRNAIPSFAPNPFGAPPEEPAPQGSPLQSRFLVFEALAQRGKGGVYRALDVGSVPARLCVVKEGRNLGEEMAEGFDGRHLVRQEKHVLRHLARCGAAVPAVITSFSTGGNEYLVLEHAEGKALDAILRRRRLALTKRLQIARSLLVLLATIESAGWLWRDCKPQNLIVRKDQSVVGLDFEGAVRHGHPAPFPWGSPGYFRPSHLKGLEHPRGQDAFAAAMILAQLFTGSPVPLPDAKWLPPLPGVPPTLLDALRQLLGSPTGPRLSELQGLLEAAAPAMRRPRSSFARQRL